MTDKLTPPQLPGWALRDLADIIDAIPSGEYGAPHFREEAARREAEPVNVAQSRGKAIGCEREGPESAAAPAVEGLVCHAEVTADGELRIMADEPTYEQPPFAHRETWEVVAITMNQICDLLLNQNDPRYALLHEFANKLGERSEELKEFAKTLPLRSESKVEAKPVPAADALVRQLRVHGGCGGADIMRKAADRIEAQAREIAATNDSLDIAQATCNMQIERADRAEAENARLREALALILPLAKGYARTYDYNSNREYVAIAEAALARGGDHG